jgi:hypothetical protein
MMCLILRAASALGERCEAAAVSSRALEAGKRLNSVNQSIIKTTASGKPVLFIMGLSFSVGWPSGGVGKIKRASRARVLCFNPPADASGRAKGFENE